MPTQAPRPRRARARTAASVHRVELARGAAHLDPAGLEATAALRHAGLDGVEAVRELRLFFLEGRLSQADVERAVRELLADPVEDEIEIGGELAAPALAGLGRPQAISVSRRTGVTNPEAESATRALQRLGLPVERVQSARTWLVYGKVGKAALLKAAAKALGNDVIEIVQPGRLSTPTFPKPQRARITRRTVPIRKSTGPALEKLSIDMGLSLSRLEMETIRDHYVSLRREPTEVELETLAQTWSEHCKHKTLAGAIRMRDENGERRYRNLLKETVFEATRKLDKEWCWSVFEDNAGVIDFDGKDGICMKVETHNHPSAIEPYGGAGTGIGGVIRDILGTGLGARPVANTDVFCFGDPHIAQEDLPKGCMHPMRLLQGVVAGVRDYGNRMGIPTVNGSILFDPRYVGNPVVYAGCVGLIPKRFVKKAARPGDLIVAFGGRTGRDGIHGATFSSVELHAESETVSSGAVQIGDPITEKKVLDVLLQARDKNMFTALTDCGAGGFSSAVGEMGEKVGADVDLSAAPLKYAGLSGFEIWISEAQERMVAAIPASKWPAFEALCASEEVEAVVLGTFTGDKRLKVRHGKTVLADMDMGFLHDGLPHIEREATFAAPDTREPKLRAKKAYDKDLLGLLAMPQIGSKEWVIRQYDHEVQAGAVVRPLVGPGHGPSDASVIAPKLGEKRGFVLGGGIMPSHGDVDPYEMARGSVDEAMRNVVSVGADPSRVAILDNFTWGNCARPETLGSIVRAAEGCRDAALLFGTPFISGKDSLNNEFRTEDGEVIVVPPTLLISAIGVINDVRKTTTSPFKRAGQAIYVVGTTHDECGGGHWYRLRGELGRNVPQVRDDAPNTHAVVSRLIRSGKIAACHDPSEGGLAVALAEMAIGSGLGAEVNLAKLPATTNDGARRLFSESHTRYVLAVDSEHKEAVETRLQKAGVAFAKVGRVTKAPTLVIRERGGKDAPALIDTSVDKLARTWRSALPVEGN